MLKQGLNAALQRFATLYEGTWRLDPDPTSVRVVPLSDSVAQRHTPWEALRQWDCESVDANYVVLTAAGSAAAAVCPDKRFATF